MSVYAFDDHRSRYLIRCFHCAERFDVVKASWCECLSQTPSLRCPSCTHCFCSAPHGYKLDFWAGAPSDFVRRNPFRARPEPRPTSLKRPLVLVIDDLATMRLLATAMLRKLGYGVAVAANGEEGLQLVRELHPDLVLTDALMPRIDGRDVCLQIKTTPTLAGIKVVVMSAVYTTSRYQTEARVRYQADDFLAKPFDMRALSDVLLEHIGPSAEAEHEAHALASS